MNDVMSMGIHRLWKDHYVSKMNPHGGMQILDVAGGTGDIAIRMLDHARTKYADRDTKVTILDINPEMLEEGKKRMAQTMYHGGQLVSRPRSSALATRSQALTSLRLSARASGMNRVWSW